MKKYKVIGNPIDHSLSPTLHNYWIKNNGIDAIYEKQKLNESELEQIIEEIKKERRCLQVNYVTFQTDWKVD